MKKSLKGWLLPVLIALAIVLLLSKFVFILVFVPTGSMGDAILPGDILYISRIFDKGDLQRGDIFVFKSDELKELLVKRLIGLPDETVEVKSDGSVYVDGDKLDEPYAVECQSKGKVFVVPENSYFFLGDCRPISSDARYWENPYITVDKIIGRAVFRLFPISRIGKVV